MLVLIQISTRLLSFKNHFNWLQVGSLNSFPKELGKHSVKKELLCREQQGGASGRGQAAIASTAACRRRCTFWCACCVSWGLLGITAHPSLVF